MAASKCECEQCKDEFYGQINSKYCSSKCKQKAYRERNKPVYYCSVNGQFKSNGVMGICGKIGVAKNMCFSSKKCEYQTTKSLINNIKVKRV